jgi:hypothetical protein
MRESSQESLVSDRQTPTGSSSSFSNDDLPASRPSAKTLLRIAGVGLGVILLPGLIVLTMLFVALR